MEKTNDLVDFMHSLTREMGEEYVRIQKRSTEDPGTAGDEGEENWAAILRNWLPADYQVVTKGRLLSESGMSSPQVDVIVLYPFYPKHLLNKKYYLTAGVAAAFECKNTLKSHHIEDAVKTSVEIQHLIKIKPATITKTTYRKELYSPIIYGLLAHSHSWQTNNSTPLDNVNEKLIELDLKHVKHPRECLDFVCISDLAVWASYKQPMRMFTYEENGRPFYQWAPGPQTAFGLSEQGMYSKGSQPQVNFTPIGTFLSKLFRKLALTDTRLKDFSWYFGQAIGGGASLRWRTWDESVLSQAARNDLKMNMNEYSKEWMDEG